MAFDIPTGEVKFRISSTQVMRGEIIEEGPRLVLINHGWSDYLKNEFKAMDGAKWLGGAMEPNSRKAWGVHNNERNRFRLAHLLDMQPYLPYDTPMQTIDIRRLKADGTPLNYDHQFELSCFVHTRHQCIIAGEMGVGKTLAAIQAMEASGIVDWMWVGPKSALDSVKYEFYNWQVCSICGKLGKHHKYSDHRIHDPKMILPKFCTYESLIPLMEKWPSGSQAPKAIIFDECSRLKTPTAKRSQAAKALADGMRRDHGRNAYIVLMSGTPAPKDPSDWWFLCEIACPGFVKEGTLQKFKYRLALIKSYEGAGGGSFPKLITWWDNELKCKHCGKFEDDPDHMIINQTEDWYHKFERSVNEVAGVYKRLNGLVNVKKKSDCLDLPVKVYKTVVCKPSPSVLRAADLIARTSTSTIKALTLLRELSDGFQYKEVENGVEQCDTCKGRLIIKMHVDLDDPNNPLDSESLTRGHRVIWSEDDTDTIIGQKEELLRLGEREVKCPTCAGQGTVAKFTREAISVPCPKDQALTDQLDLYEDEGRVVVWAGFTESIERCTQTIVKAGWPVMRLDGRGWWCNTVSGDGFAMLSAFDDKQAHPKMAFVGQPGAGGMGLNLTASSVEIYYSNTFKFEDRAQSEDRIHRPGADHQRGCSIIDLIHLPQDLWVLDNLKKKRDLQAMTMGMLAEAASHYLEQVERDVT